MIVLQASLHPAPASLPPANMAQIESLTLPTYAFDPQSAQTGWDVTFDQAYARMESMPQMFLEPDGSWFWTSPAGEPRWQLEGNLYDAGALLGYVDIKGFCPRPAMEKLLGCLGWPANSIMVQVSRLGLFITADDFLKVIDKTSTDQK